MAKKKHLQYSYWTADRELYGRMKETAARLALPLGTVTELALRHWLECSGTQQESSAVPAGERLLARHAAFSHLARIRAEIVQANTKGIIPAPSSSLLTAAPPREPLTPKPVPSHTEPVCRRCGHVPRVHWPRGCVAGMAEGPCGCARFMER